MLTAVGNTTFRIKPSTVHAFVDLHVLVSQESHNLSKMSVKLSADLGNFLGEQTPVEQPEKAEEGKAARVTLVKTVHMDDIA